MYIQTPACLLHTDVELTPALQHWALMRVLIKAGECDHVDDDDDDVLVLITITSLILRCTPGELGYYSQTRLHTSDIIALMTS